MAAVATEQHSLDEFGIESAIAGFLADKAASSLEFPHMTTGQRKHTKKLAELHPELTCESYGFGQERQLHLFKKSPRGSRAKGAAGGKATPSRPPAQDSAVAGTPAPPVLLPARALWPPAAEDRQPDAAFPAEKAPAKAERWLVDIAGADCSTAAASSCSSGSPRSSIWEVPSKPPGLPTPTNLQIRNTFIDFRTPPKDGRVVQSMPHDMFKQCLWAEALSAHIAEEALLSPQTASTCGFVAGGGPLAPGTQIEISGLLKLPAFNGLRAVVQSLDEETGRYNILFPAPVDGHTRAKVKRENLCPISPSLLL